METHSTRTHCTALLALSLLLADPTLAAPHPVNTIVGKWHTTVPTNMHTSSRYDFTFKADDTETQIVTMLGYKIVIRATYTAKDGKLHETLVSSTINGRPAHGFTTGTTKYTLNRDTLMLTPRISPAPIVLHRVKG